MFTKDRMWRVTQEQVSKQQAKRTYLTSWKGIIMKVFLSLVIEIVLVLVGFHTMFIFCEWLCLEILKF